MLDNIKHFVIFSNSSNSFRNVILLLFCLKYCLKQVQKPEKDLRIYLNRSNPTVKAKEGLQNVFKQDSGQNRGKTMFPKESDELENITKCFLCCPPSLLECWNNMGAMLDESLKEYLKIEIRIYQVYVVFTLMRVKDDVVLLQKLSQRWRTSES